jgi:hypothetical protein
VGDIPIDTSFITLPLFGERSVVEPMGSFGPLKGHLVARAISKMKNDPNNQRTRVEWEFSAATGVELVISCYVRPMH